MQLRRYDAEGRLIFGVTTPTVYSRASEWLTWNGRNLVAVDSYLEDSEIARGYHGGPLDRTIEHAELTWQDGRLARVTKSRRVYRRAEPGEVWRLHDHEDSETRYRYRGPWLEFIGADSRFEFEGGLPVRHRGRMGLVLWNDYFTSWTWKDGRITTYQWSNYVQRFEYDAKGRLTLDRLDDAQGHPVTVLRWEYDERGSIQRLVTQEFEFKPHGPPDEWVRTYRYDDGGREVAANTVNQGVEDLIETVYSGDCANVQERLQPPNVLDIVGTRPCFYSLGFLYQRCF